MEARLAQLPLPNPLGGPNGQPTAPDALTEREGAVAGPATFVGLCAFATAMQLFDDLVVLQSTNMFNCFLYAVLAQVLMLAVLGIVGFAHDWNVPRAFAPIAAVAAAFGSIVAMGAANTVVGCAAATVAGFGMAVLSVAWGCRLAATEFKNIAAIVCSALLVGACVCAACFLMPKSAAPCVLAVTMLLACLPWVLDLVGQRRCEPVPVGSASGVPGRLYVMPVSALVALGACCLVCSFFAGATMNPYAMQSNTLAWVAHMVVICAFITGTTFSWTLRSFSLGVSLLFALAMLLVGLLLLSTGIAGNVVVPIGFICGTRTVLWGISLVVLVAIARAYPGKATGVLGLGLLVCNGALGRGIGLMASSTHASFTDLAIVGVVAIVAMAFVYAFTAASPQSARMIEVGFDMGVRVPQQDVQPEVPGVEPKAEPGMFDELGLSEREHIVAQLIAEGRTYNAIAEHMDISLSTVKFHASNIYQKAGVSTKAEFRENYKTS